MVSREQANEALLRIDDEEMRQYVARQVQHQGQNRVVGDVDAAGNPDCFVLRIEVLMPAGWKTLTYFRPADIGLSAEEIAQEIQLVRYQSGVDIPDDISGLTDPPT
jgi:hypothetical protein